MIGGNNKVPFQSHRDQTTLDIRPQCASITTPLKAAAMGTSVSSPTAVKTSEDQVKWEWETRTNKRAKKIL